MRRPAATSVELAPLLVGDQHLRELLGCQLLSVQGLRIGGQRLQLLEARALVTVDHVEDTVQAEAAGRGDPGQQLRALRIVEHLLCHPGPVGLDPSRAHAVAAAHQVLLGDRLGGVERDRLDHPVVPQPVERRIDTGDTHRGERAKALVVALAELIAMARLLEQQPEHQPGGG